MYKQLVAVAPREAALLSYQDRPILPHEVRVQVQYASPKHGSELADFRGETPFLDEQYDAEWQLFLPRATQADKGVKFGEWNLGNQWVGVIREVGADVQDYLVGDLVCSYGGIRETQIVPAVDNFRLRKLPAGMSWKNAVCYDPAQFALGGIRDSQMRAGDRVAVIGLGAIGQLAAQMAKQCGASYVAVVDPIAIRRDVALQAGVDDAFDPLTEDVGLALKKATGKLGVDVIIETSANAHALQAALRGLAYGGTIAYVGWARAWSGGLDLGREAHFNNAKIVFSRVASEPNPDSPRWNRRRIEDVCWDMLSSGKLDCEGIVTPVVAFEESAAAYCEYVDRSPELSIKLGIRFEQEGGGA
ncbi:zinc-dependent alcohol dehydrogenase [Tumebacillus permanentifrigoris]|uniref:Threonine dehydrogenase-like Zn-dependent dehydrogenase n=1 Tax=Tumebacillus permanentifrigoris TaxID=378543 RepID=A0A316DGB9_9BACL|nr:zinc-binding alcohol dehydrogenase [Tumebacillus permanentifrigoris]PWK16572.1 threonine dehydrogenase-like Zn-dependent dehydrogenase [Tumebacillus permanentifrigoris]